MSEKYFKAL